MTKLPLTDILRLVLPLLGAIIAVLTATSFSQSDTNLAIQLGFTGLNNSGSVFWLIPPAILVSFIACEAAQRIRIAFLPLVFIQLTAVSLLLTWMGANYAHRFSVMSAIVASLVGFSLGILARAFKSAADKQTSRYFELAIKNNELNQTRLSLLKQDEADRRILASDLHDQVLNEIKSIKSKIVEMEKSGADSSQIKDVERSLDSASKHIRDVMESLFPSVLENLGLASALDQLTRDTGHKASLQARFLKTISDEKLLGLTKTEELLLFRLTQEALNNVVKHAQARTVRVNLEQIDNRLCLSIRDDGKGFVEKERGDSRGLRYMRLRADLIGASISWQANESLEEQAKGTTVKIELTIPVGTLT